jgi:hypothetical protein
VIGSWDGVVDNDRLRIVVDGTDTLLHASFSNTVYRQSYPDDVGKGVHRQRSEARRQNTLGFRFVEPGIYAGPLDATYHIMVANDHRADSITITFEGILKDLRKGIDNESWALRGVEVKTRRPPALYHRAIMVPSAPSFEEDAFPGIVTTAPVLHELRVPVVVIECPSCGPSCESFSLSVFADRTVARWAGYPRRGEPTAVITLQPSEYDTVEALVQQCLHDSLAYRYVVSTMQGSSATPQRQCEVLLGIAGEARTVVVRDDPPASMQALTSTLRMLFTRYGWNNVP